MRLRDTCTILRAGTLEDPYGGTGSEPDWSTATETDSACSIQPGQSREMTADREQVVADWIAYLPAETDITSADRISWRSLTFTVSGDVGLWVRGATAHHLEVPLERVG